MIIFNNTTVGAKLSFIHYPGNKNGVTINFYTNTGSLVYSEFLDVGKSLEYVLDYYINTFTITGYVNATTIYLNGEGL
jgi:hypothetical protein